MKLDVVCCVVKFDAHLNMDADVYVGVDVGVDVDAVMRMPVNTVYGDCLFECSVSEHDSAARLLVIRERE